MGSDVGHPRPVVLRESGQCAQLIHHISAHLFGWQIDRVATEPAQIGKARMRPQGHALLDALRDRDVHDQWITGVEAARDVRAGDDFQQRIVIAHLPTAEALAEVGNQIDRLGRRLGGHDVLPMVNRLTGVPAAGP
ncbi:hypothetical protein SDC9_201624 [bioreactor metagenome]|uniref:Uncharacterized protein n=1 Tax=bioreactor metagenome TaxID=1076179 RepID=A0A645IRG8_9ZZZZ